MTFLGLLTLPLRAPLLSVLFGVAIVMGNQWSLFQPEISHHRDIPIQVFLVFEVVQVLAVLVICTMPDLLMRNVSLVMASSRVMTLLVTLLLVIVSGLYLLRLNLLSDLLILASALLLARLDLIRVGIIPTPRLSMLLLGTVLFVGIALGHQLPHPTAGLFAEPNGGI